MVQKATHEELERRIQQLESEALRTQIEDITERKAIEETLRESESRYRELVQNANSAIIRWKRDGTIAFCNEYAQAFFGYRAEEMIGKHVNIIVPDTESTGAHLTTLAQDIASHPEKYVKNINENVCRDGRRVWMVWTNKALFDQDGEVDEILAIGSDITRQKKAEDALLRERDFITAVLDTAGALVIVLDRQGRITRFNRRCEEVTGYSTAYVSGRVFWEFLVPPEELAGVIETWKALTAGDFPNVHENSWLNKDGSKRLIAWSNTAITGETGQVDYVIGTGIDVTDRKRAEERIVRQNTTLRAINTIFHETMINRSEEDLGRTCLSVAEGITGSRIGFIAELGEDGLLHDIAISDPGWKLCSMHEKTGHRGWTINLHIHGLYGRVLADGKSLFTNDPDTHPDRIGVPMGHPPIDAFLGVPLSRGGRTIGMVAMGNREGGYRQEDVEAVEALAPAIVESFAKIRAEQALARAKEQLQQERSVLDAILKSTDMMLVYLDRDFNFLVVNPAYAKTCKMRPEEMIGKNHFDLYPHAENEAIFRRVRDSGEPVFYKDKPFEFPDQPERGVTYWDWSLIPVKNDSGVVIGLVFSLRETTKYKQAEEELRKSRDTLEQRVKERTADLEKMYEEQKINMRLLEQTNRDLEDFVHVASHDLQEPLRKIQTFAELLMTTKRNSLDDQTRDYLDRMHKAAQRMQALVVALLKYSQVTTNLYEFSMFNLREAVSEAISDLGVLCEEKEGRVEVSELPDIQADRVQMRQLFQNLIGNSLKFRGEKKPVVKVSNSGSPPDGFWEILVEDNGIGFDERYLDRIFKPFRRLHPKKSLYEGTGMGLAICRRIVERHGGSITAKSEPGKGATFVVRLPKKQFRREKKL